MNDDLTAVLVKFHRDVLLPDVRRVVEEAVGASERRLRDEMHGLFDALAHRLDRLETEYQMIVASLKRVEQRLDAIEGRLDKMALKSDLDALKLRVAELQGQIQDIEARL